MALMNFTPQTIVKLLSGVPLDSTYVNTRDFANVAEQQAFFAPYVVDEFNNFTYQRETAVIRVPIRYERAVRVNYCMYLNSNFGTKWFYAFVTKVDYVNPEMSALHIETDVIQTWMFEYVPHQCFIERETPANDTLYGNTIPEDLEYGPIRVAKEGFTTAGDYYTVLAYFDNQGQGGQVINNVFSGVQYLVYNTSTANGVAQLNAKLAEIDEAGLADNIVGMFLIPNLFRTNEAQSVTVSVSASSLNGYTPRNKKLLGWPYRYAGISWGMGQENILRYELMQGGNLTLKMRGSMNVEAQGFMWPANYAGLADNYGEGVLLTDLPQCSWISNVYANWIARNKYSLLTEGAQVAGNVVRGALFGDLGAAVSGVTSAINIIAQRGDRSNYPTGLAGQAGTSTIWATLERIGVCVRQYEITAEYARIIDQFFDRYGYKVCKNGLPNTKSRKRWNYIKTSGISITGPLPVEHLEQLQRIYNNGVTFWHDDAIGDYTANNS